MAEGVYLNGWDAASNCWRAILVNAEGKLIIDPSEIFEDPPTEDEHGKAPASSWAFDHKADAAAHHAKYTDAESRAAIGNKFNSIGRLLSALDCDSQSLEDAKRVVFKDSSDALYYGGIYIMHNQAQLRSWVYEVGVGYADFTWKLYKTDHYVFVIDEDNLLSKYSELKGSQYLSIPGTGFLGQQSFSDDIDYDVSSGKVSLNVDDCVLMAPVNLPEGSTVKGVIVYGNAAAEAETFELRRVKLIDATNSQMATQNINTEDITISDPVIDNGNYAYFIVTSSLDIGDEIYGALIVYEL